MNAILVTIFVLLCFAMEAIVSRKKHSIADRNLKVKNQPAIKRIT
jgi:preprotein translocase subunit SecG